MSSDPTSIGRFTIHSRLGKGGMGVVYLARDPDLDRFVAVKLLRVTDEEVRERFLREARTTGRLQHPNIVTTFERGEQDGRPFIAMEYVSGETLAEIIGRRAQLTADRKVALIQQLCAGLSYAHQAGIVHRDIKPANLMVSREGGLLKILDFGIARLAEGSGTMVGMVLGTPAYMSPEQIQGEAVGIRSDVFSVGAVLYELLVYRKAFGGDNQTQVQQRILNATDDVFSRIGGVVSTDLEKVLRRALARNIEDRYPDLGAMDADLATASTIPPADQWDQTVVFDRREDIARRRGLRIEGHLTRTRAALVQRDFPAAHDAVDAALVLDPENADAQTLMTRIEKMEVDESVGASLEAARDQFDAGDLSEAIRRVDEALRTRPGDPDGEALKRSVEAAVVQRERERAEARAIADSLTQCRDALQAGAFERAVRAADEVLVFDAEHAVALELKSHATAEIEARREQKEREQHAHSEVEFARVEFASGEQTGALRRLEQFDPPHPFVTEVLGELREERAAQEMARQEQERQRQEEAERQAFDAWVDDQAVAIRSAVAEKRLDDAEALLGVLSAKGRPIASLDALEAGVRTARDEVDAERIAGMLVEASAHLESEDFNAASAVVDNVLAVDSAHTGALSLRSDIQQARARAEEQQREAAITEGLACANDALAAEDFEAARGRCKKLLAVYPAEPRVTALVAKIGKSSRAAALRDVQERVGRLGESARHSGEAVVGRIKGLTRRGSTVSRKGLVSADAGRGAGLLRGRAGLAAAAGVAVTATVVAVIVLVRPATTDVDVGEVTDLLEAGQLVPAATLIVEALAVEPRHEEFQSLAARLLEQAELGIAGPRGAAQGASDALLLPPRAAEAEAIRLRAAGDLVPAVNAFSDSARLYREASLRGANLGDVISQARSILVGAWVYGRDLSEQQLAAAAERGEQARIIAGGDIAVAALITELWDTAAAHVQRAQAEALSAGGASLDLFSDAVDEEAEAQRMYEVGDLGVAVAGAGRSAVLFGDARDHAVLLGRIRRALNGAQTALTEGRLVEAISRNELGLGLARNPDRPARTDEFLTLRDDIVSRAEFEALSVKAALPSAVVADDAEALLREAENARDASQFVVAVEKWLAAAATFEDATASFVDPLAQALRGIRASLNEGDLERATRQVGVVLVQAGDELEASLLHAVGEVRAVAERRVADAKNRAAVNTGHPDYSIAEEQEMGGRGMTDPRQLVEAAQYYARAVDYYDQAAEAAVVTTELNELIEIWERAFGARDNETLLRLYQPQSLPGQDSRALVETWLQSFGESRRWQNRECGSVRRNTQGQWFTTCRVTVTMNGNVFPQTYLWALERRDGTVVIISNRRLE